MVVCPTALHLAYSEFVFLGLDWFSFKSCFGGFSSVGSVGRISYASLVAQNHVYSYTKLQREKALRNRNTKTKTKSTNDFEGVLQIMGHVELA